MAAPRTWRVPVRGRFTFTPSERQKVRVGGFVPQRAMPLGDSVGEEIIDKTSCYFCALGGGHHRRGCPRFF